MRQLSRLLVLVLGLTLLSCGDESPTEPAAAPQFSLESDKLSQLARYRTGALQINIGLALKTIGPLGARLESRSADGGHQCRQRPVQARSAADRR